MRVFNSLGSNYGRGFALKNLFARSRSEDTKKLEAQLGQVFGGQAVLTYKGRDALELALRRSGLPEGSKVGINGFTCFVVYQAVINAGYQAVFIDVDDGRMDFGPQQLAQSVSAHPDMKAVIVQNSLGIPVDMNGIKEICQKQGMLIIEDLAHSVGATYADGSLVGTAGAFTMLSFSQDKPIDVVAGGAMIDRLHNVPEPVTLEQVSGKQRLVNRLYPLFTGWIRALYSIGIGKVLHTVLKSLKLMATPMSENIKGLHAMSPQAVASLQVVWPKWQDTIKHRQTVAAIYQQNLPKELAIFDSSFGTAAYLRFPLWVENRAQFIAFMKQNGIYVADTWYDAPVAPPRYMKQTSYQPDECPRAESLAKHIVNLPTHEQITPEIAQSICDTIKRWQQSQVQK